MNNDFCFSNSISAKCDPKMINKTTNALWKSFSLNLSAIELTPGGPNSFIIGSPEKRILPNNKEYLLSIEEKGIYIVGKDYGSLMRGFFSLLMKIKKCGLEFIVKPTLEQSNYVLKNRMIHICIFPETDLYFIKKLIRLSALCQYTHIVIEFWGMIKYDCLKELSWPNALTKDTVRELILECRELGIEPVPMFNQLGHATSSRCCYGKHVVLDQNPTLEHLFTPDGWAWNIESSEVKTLLKNIREELYEVFGQGEFMHIGCDEAYYISQNDQLRKLLPDYLKELTNEVENEGRRPMLWMDMLLEKGIFPDCFTVGEKNEVEKIRNSTAKSSVFVDWQYGCNTTPVPSLASLKNCGRDVMGAPWYETDNYTAHIDTIAQNNMFGLMLTTWHTLRENMPSILGCAKKFGAVTFTWSEFSGLHEETATLMRRISFEGNNYANSGWSEKQIEV